MVVGIYQKLIGLDLVELLDGIGLGKLKRVDLVYKVSNFGLVNKLIG